MFGRNTGRQKRAAALSLRGTCACYAELERADETWRMITPRVFELPPGCVSDGHIIDGARLGEYLRGKLRFCWKKLPLVVGVPTADCVFQLISLPAANTEEAREALRWRFERHFPFSYEEAFFDVCEVRLPAQKSSEIGVMAVAASRKELEPLFEALKNHSSRVFAAEPLAVACARSLLPLAVEGEGKSVFLAAFLDYTVQLCFVRNSSGLLFRGFCLKDATLASDDALEECAFELRKTLDYVKTRFACNAEVLVAASEAQMTRLRTIPELSPAKTAAISSSHRLEASDAICSEWFDVTGLLQRYANDDGI